MKIAALRKVETDDEGKFYKIPTDRLLAILEKTDAANELAAITRELLLARKYLPELIDICDRISWVRVATEETVRDLHKAERRYNQLEKHSAADGERFFSGLPPRELEAPEEEDDEDDEPEDDEDAEPEDDEDAEPDDEDAGEDDDLDDEDAGEDDEGAP